MTDTVRILGAGLSGLSAAITLARAGRTVEVFEKRSDCGMRFGGDLQGLENWSRDVDVVEELRALGLPGDFHCAPFAEGVQTNGRTADHFRFSRPAFYLVKRGREADTIDQAFKRAALAAGVTIHFGVTRSPRTVHIDASGPVGRAPFAVDTGIVFETDAPDQAIALLDDDAGNKGYAYLLVTQGYGCCCAMSFDDFPGIHRGFARARRLLLDEPGITVRNPRTVGGLGHFTTTTSWRTGDTVRVGEAAGLQDFLWGFGMRLAIGSGVLAARALIDGGDYAAAAEREFALVRRAGVVNRFLWEAGRVAGYRPIMAALRWRGPERALRWMHRPSRTQALLWPVASWWARKAYGARLEPRSAPLAGA
jgi:flavin-dependent dehydrogenase